MPEVPEVHEMIPAERRARIVDLVRERRAVRVSTLSENLSVSGMTIRRDLERLETEGVLVRTHGGAILRRYMAEETFYGEREGASAEEKRRIAAAAAQLIETGDTVFLSSGTTAAQVIRHLEPSLEARIVTHNVGAMQEARGLGVEVVLVGGVYRSRSNAVDGSLALEQVSRFHAGKFLIGVDGFDLEEGLTTPTMGMAGVERAMLAQTRGEVVALADASKIGMVADVVICGLEEVDTVLVDDGVSEPVREEMTRLGLRCSVV
jgi:DeoR/GlpR family transcriptional regulator of sugar metabolism